MGISQSSNDPNSCEALVIEWSNSMGSATNHQREYFSTVIFPRCSHPELVSGSVWREGAVRREGLWVLISKEFDLVNYYFSFSRVWQGQLAKR